MSECNTCIYDNLEPYDEPCAHCTAVNSAYTPKACRACRWAETVRHNANYKGIQCALPGGEHEGTEPAEACADWTAKTSALTCYDPRPCFARHLGACTILTSTYDEADRPCPFCKPERAITKGKRYGYKKRVSR